MKSPMKIILKLVVAMLLVGCAGSLGLIGQAAQQKSDSRPQAEAQPQPEEQSQTESQRKSRGVAQQLVHETREAAGEEEDDRAAFKSSTSVQLVSKWTGLDLRRAYWLCVITNFVIVVAIIVWAGRKVLPGFFRDRTAAIQKAMQEAQKASAEARTRLAEIESRLAKLDVEIGAMRDAAEKEATAEAERIKAAAEEDARKIVAAAELEIAAAAKAARRQLTAHAADLAVGLAQKQIRVDAATDQALVRNFAGQLGENAESSGWRGERKDGN